LQAFHTRRSFEPADKGHKPGTAGQILDHPAVLGMEKKDQGVKW
jgi:hypothetical protein